MSEEIKRYTFKGAAGYYVYSKDYDTAQSQLAALREDLSQVRDDMAAQRNHFRSQLADAKDTDKLLQRLADAERRNADLAVALKFYADSDHYSTDDQMNWDSCSGEPSNILWHESEPWFIEDGSIARAALNHEAKARGRKP